MAPDERREMIAAAAVPLFLEHGQALTTRQLAEHLGIAEGTIFRAFGDKDALVRAAVQAFFAAARERSTAGLVDASLPLERKVAALVAGARVHMRNMFTMLSLVDRDEVAQLIDRSQPEQFNSAVAAAFAPDAARLRVPLEHLGAIIRIAGIAARTAHVDAGPAFSDDELVQFILYGIAGRPAEGS